MEVARFKCSFENSTRGLMTGGGRPQSLRRPLSRLRPTKKSREVANGDMLDNLCRDNWPTANVGNTPMMRGGTKTMQISSSADSARCGVKVKTIRGTENDTF